ncbi:MAG: N-acetyl-gamma-glutamyl-phosphate reductase [Phycisphaerae bacterium]|nr:N-acetyl-gamma-glutamyl-phosphate reductase [Phycisphaerae bacterium]
MSNRKSAGKIRAVLIGGSGYAGFEAIRWLLRHPGVELVGIYGPPNELGPMEKFYPLLSGQVTLSQELFDADKVAAVGADVALLCVPHVIAMNYVPALRKKGLRVIDWSADYRLRDADEYKKWYAHEHTDTGNLAEAVYGLPEYFADEIRTAKLIANPGCYPTCSALGLAPLLAAGLIEPAGIVVNAISGVSGAGRTPKLANHYPERNESFEPYGVGNHRHMPEIEQTLAAIIGQPVELLFQPHLCPMDRGMLCSIYARPTAAGAGKSAEELTQVFQDAYAKAPFVRVRTDVLPATKYVAYTNFCDVAVRVAKGRVIVFTALDNLIKGASGQAIQNMNLMFGFDETAGLI